MSDYQKQVNDYFMNCWNKPTMNTNNTNTQGLVLSGHFFGQ